MRSGPCPWLSLSSHGVVVEVNDRLCALLGRPAADLVGRPLDSLLSHASRVLYQSFLQPLLRLHGQVEELALALLSAEGQSVEVLIYSSRLPDDEGGLVEMVLAPIRQRRRIELEMLRVKRAADQAPGMIFQLLRHADGRAHFPYVSEAIRPLYGCSASEAAESAEVVWARIHPEDRPRVEQSLAEAQQGPKDWRCLYRVVLADGSLHWHEALASGKALADHTVLWHGHVADVSFRHEMEHALAERQALERFEKERSEFFARVSHELRTPLNGILGFAQLLQAPSAQALSPQQAEFVDLIRSSGSHLLALINQLLEISRIGATEAQVDLQPVPLRPLIEHAMQIVGPDAQTFDVNVLPLECHPGLQVLAHELHLRQVLLNLLSNALKYNRPGGSLMVSASAAGADVTVRVIDEGLGLTPEQSESLFQPFNRLGAQASGIQGAGLGLVITKQLLTLMGGSITVQSAPGLGSCFAFTLRAAPELEANGVSGVADPGDIGAAPPAFPVAQRLDSLGEVGLVSERVGSTARGKVLYVEDNEVNVLLMQALMGMRPGVSLTVAADGASALAALDHFTPDLLLLDMHLPDMLGTELLRALRLRGGLSHVPAVAVSAAAHSEDIRAALATGFAAYWTKPLDIDRTLADLDSLLLPR